MSKILMDPRTNPRGLWLMQDGADLLVLSECCAAAITPESFIERMDAAGNQYREVWAICNVCRKELERNDRGWISDLGSIELHIKTNPTSWGLWAAYWFGLENFAMKVE